MIAAGGASVTGGAGGGGMTGGGGSGDVPTVPGIRGDGREGVPVVPGICDCGCGVPDVPGCGRDSGVPAAGAVVGVPGAAAGVPGAGPGVDVPAAAGCEGAADVRDGTGVTPGAVAGRPYVAGGAWGTR
ncbi:hypothetical protein [Micromonospora sp. C28ISP2-4]|uniref:hypothetical protein n=1 Tax=Micromonospora sp. C28ISP2-4 TaxID=3059523 RepID=UPI0026765560|nr:hypothetical protein [Micromonospora sp. C28ISP2-4]MDO3686488.1 hypothetical protein [Micromonospora sp. C28ISP2-4]